ncbi:MAG: DUF4249 domain-containing protein [Chitinophagaceae bacterium]
MKNNLKILAILIISLFCSCEKVINVDLKSADAKIVIEGIIDNSGNPATVKITKSVPFSNSSSFPAIRGAIVTISDNDGNNYSLTENPEGTYRNASLIGIVGRTYQLTVNLEGKKYTASATIPNPINLDTLLQDKIIITKPVLFVSAAFDDPKAIENNYQFIETVNSKRSTTIFLLNDQFQDGGTITYEMIDEELKLKTGDTVEVEMQCIDKKIYRYLRGLEDLQFNNTVPANPESNLDNNVLGYFSAHTSQKKIIVIK